MNILGETLKLELLRTLLKATEIKGKIPEKGAVKKASSELLIRNLNQLQTPLAKGGGGVASLPHEAYATLLTQSVEPLLELLGRSDALGDHDKSIKTRQLVPLFTEMPVLIDDFIKMWETLKKGAAPEKAYDKLVDLFEGLKANFFGVEAQKPSPSWTGPLNDMRMVVRFLAETLETQVAASGPKVSFSIDQALHFLNFSLKENPALFKADLFGYAAALKVGLDTETYIKLSHHVHPIRLGTLLLRVGESEKNSLIQSLKLSVKDAHQIKKILNLYEYKMGIKELPELAFRSEKNNETGYIELRGDEKREVPLLLLDRDEGLISYQNITPTETPYETSFKGFSMVLQAFPTGLHRIKLKVKRNKKKQVDLLELLFNVVGKNQGEVLDEPLKGLSREDEEKLKRYGGLKIRDPLFSAGSLHINLQAPLLVLNNFESQNTPKASLHLEFDFLSEYVNKNFKFSRKDFLTFEESDSLARFRSSLYQLSQKGLAGFDEYSQSLNGLMEKLKRLVAPNRMKAFEEARVYLRDEVLGYLMGKKIFERKLEMSEGDKRGEVLACVCQTAAHMSLATAGVSEALIHLMDASRYAPESPSVQKRVLSFFNLLRKQMGLKSNENFSFVDDWMGYDYRVFPGYEYYTTSKAAEEAGMDKRILSHFLESAHVMA